MGPPIGAPDLDRSTGGEPHDVHRGDRTFRRSMVPRHRRCLNVRNEPGATLSETRDARDAGHRGRRPRQGLWQGRQATRAVDGITFDVAPGKLFGLLGPNGAGKTTTIRILATLLRRHRGTARVAGLDVAREPHEVRSRLGLALQTVGAGRLLDRSRDARAGGSDAPPARRGDQAPQRRAAGADGV